MQKACYGFKHDLEDALDHLDAISKSKNLPNAVAKQTEELKNMLHRVEKYTEENRIFAHLGDLPKHP